MSERNVVFLHKKSENTFNEFLVRDKFPDCLKLANITLVFKKGAVPQNFVEVSNENFQCGFRQG